MNADDLADDDVAFALRRGQFGFAVLDRDLAVRERRGDLASWLPELGRPCGESPVLHSMEATLEAIRDAGAAPLVLPSIGLPGRAPERVTISVDWNPASQRFVVLIAPDEGAKHLDRLLYQQRRERQVLQEQAAAASDRLRVSTTLYRDIVESTEDAVLRLAPDLVVTFVNSRAAQGFGIAPEAALGRPIREILPLPAQDNPWRADMCSGGAASFEQPARDVNGETQWVWWDVRWLGEADGPREFQAVGRDVTQTRRLRAELERANQEARFAALAEERLRIAHDLHDTFVHSLVSLKARLSLLGRTAPDGGLRRELTEAEEEARSGLKAAREAVGLLRTDFEFPAGPSGPLAEAANALRAKGGVRVELDIAPDLGDVAPSAATAIVRVAREALRNVELHSSARHVSIALRRTDAALVLDIEDDGIGFDPRRPPSGHYGLVGMREQARLAGGALEIEAAPSAGVKLKLTLA